MLWQNRDLELNPSVDTSGPDLPTTAGELFSAAWSRNQLVTENYFGEHDRFDALGDYQNIIKQKTGVDVAQGLDYGTGTTGVTPAAQEMLRQTNQKVAELKAKDPTLDLEQMTPDELEQNAVAKRRQADADFQALVSRPRGRGATAGLEAGEAAAGFADPINIAALPLAPADGLGLLANALRWGLIGAGGAAAGEVLKAPYQEEVQPGYITSGQPALNIAAAFGETALTGGAFRGIADVWDRVSKGAWPQSVRQAGNLVSGQANVTSSNVYPGADGEAAHEQALPKAIGDIFAGRPVDVSKHITPELEASARPPAPVETGRLDAQAAAANAVRPVPTEAAPELPFERTAAEAQAAAKKQSLILDVWDAARNGGHDDMPMEEAGRIADKLMDATPDQAQKIFRDLQISPRQVADAPAREEIAAKEIPTPVSRVDAAAPDFQASVRAGLDRELAAMPPAPAPRPLAEIDAGQAPATLPEEHARYFKLDENTRIVPIADLISSKTPEENMKGAANGAKRMAASARGELGRRAPITVEQLPDGKFLVLDGNGTMTAARNYGWRALPVKAESGTPSLAASAGETGRLAPGMSWSGVTEPGGAVIQPTPLAQVSTRTEPLGSLIARTTSPSMTTGPTRIFSEFRVGDIDSASTTKIRPILQGSNDLRAIRERMEQNKPLVDDKLNELVGKVKGAEYHGSRVKKLEGPTGLEAKAATLAAKGRGPNTISDYLGARVIADNPDALSEFAQRIHDTGAVIEDENFLHDSKQGYRARHLQVSLGDGTSFELQLVPRPIAEVMDTPHEMRQAVKRNDLSDPAQAEQFRNVMNAASKIFDDKWAKAAHWVAGRPPERIEGVAIRDRETGKVYSKPNVMHVDMYDRAAKDLGMTYEQAYNARTTSGRGRFDEGFTTNTGRYVGRKEAATIAQRMGQAVEVRAKGLDAGDLKPIESPIPNGVQMFSPYELGVDPERFQFKAGGDEAGVTDRLKDVKTWDPIKAGMSLVWVDDAGKPWIIDGHQRLGLARRIAGEDPAQNPQIWARTLRQDEGVTPADARTTAALKNIAEGTGTALDAAKVIRDHPERIDELPPRSELVRQARGLANLSPDAFRLVINDVVPPSYAAIVGRLVPGDMEMQTALLHLLAKTDPANAVQAEAIARQGIEAGLAKKEAGAQASMFGDMEVAESLYAERAKVLDRALKTLRRDKTVFGTLVKEAETVETAGNVLAKDINEKRAIADGQALQILQTLANRAGPISDALRTAAGAARTDGYPAATRQFVATVRDAVSSGELARLANGIERGATHVGDETTAGTIDRGLAAEPSQPAAIAAADQQIRTTFEPGAEGLPQGVMPGMEASARQLAAARAGPLRAGVPQEEPGELFSPAPQRLPDMFFDAGGRPQSLESAIGELDQYKIAAEQLAACAAPAAEGAAA